MRFLKYLLLVSPLVLLSSCALPDPALLGIQSAAETGGAKAPPKKKPARLNALHNADVDHLPFVQATRDRLEYIQANVDGPYCALTFDDGPHPTLTPKLLDILAERNVRCTFYVVGPQVRMYPEIMKRMVAEGHEVANHTMTHRDIRRISVDRMKKELRDCHKLLVDITGQTPLTFRPPGGGYNDRLMKIIYDDLGYSTFIWTVDTNDWRRPGVDVVTKRLINGASPGAILLCHDIHPPTIEAIPAAVDGILQKGYTFVTVSQLVGLEKNGNAKSAPDTRAVRQLAYFGPGAL
jgi:peptidoglycan-N-acetylglucosamine deacetylase